MADVERVNVMSVEDDNQNNGNNEAGNKKSRKRKTKAEKLAEKMDKLEKLQANVAQLTKQIEWEQKSPAEKKDYKRKLDTHCKTLAGAIALKMFADKDQKFDRETFKNAILATIKNFEDKAYFDKIFQ